MMDAQLIIRDGMIFIPGEVPGLKNNKSLGKNKMPTKSKPVREYLKSLGIQDYRAKTSTDRKTKEKREKYIRYSEKETYRTLETRKYMFQGAKLEHKEWVRKTRKCDFRLIAGWLKTDVDYPTAVAYRGQDEPVRIGFHFVRGTNRMADFTALVEILADLFVAAGVIEDDGMKHFFPFPLMVDGKLFSVAPDKPGVWVKVL